MGSPAFAAARAAVAGLDLDPPTPAVLGPWRGDQGVAVEPWPVGAVAERGADGAWLARCAVPPSADGPLAGLRVCVKDLIDVAGVPTTAGSGGWSRRPAADAPAVAALRAAGARVVGKGHTNEFAYGCDGRNPHWPPCPNPWDVTRVCGGSSSGPAAAVAAGEADLGLGTDTSGSIRIPAALCGLAGLRPTHGLVSTDGVVPLAPSFDAVGPLARDVATVASAMRVLAGWDAVTGPREDLRGRRVAVVVSGPPRVGGGAGAGALGLAGAAMARLGVELVAVAVPSWPAGLAAQRATQFGESAEVHARRFPGPRRPAYSAPVRDRLVTGRAMPLAEVALARRAARAFAAGLLGFLAREGLDALLLPGALDVAPTADGTDAEVREALLGPVAALSLTRGPVLSVPTARLRGLPLGVQLAAAPGADRALLSLGLALERELAAAGR